MGREAFQYGEGAGVGERARKEVLCETRAGNKLQHFLDGYALVQLHVIGLHAKSYRAKSLDDIAGGGLAGEIDLYGITAVPSVAHTQARADKTSPALHLLRPHLPLLITTWCKW